MNLIDDFYFSISENGKVIYTDKGCIHVSSLNRKFEMETPIYFKTHRNFSSPKTEDSYKVTDIVKLPFNKIVYGKNINPRDLVYFFENLYIVYLCHAYKYKRAQVQLLNDIDYVIQMYSYGYNGYILSDTSTRVYLADIWNKSYTSNLQYLVNWVQFKIENEKLIIYDKL